jgi:hypothetical protein
MILLTSDPVVGSGILLAFAVSSVQVWRRGVRGRRFAATLLLLFTGIALSLTMTAHTVEVLFRLAGGKVYNDPPLAYDFRAYSLLLFGVVLFLQGVGSIRAGAAVSRGDSAARRDALRTVLTVLALVVPIIPIHPFFGPMGTTLGLIGLIGALLAPAELELRTVDRAQTAQPEFASSDA